MSSGPALRFGASGVKHSRKLTPCSRICQNISHILMRENFFCGEWTGAFVKFGKQQWSKGKTGYRLGTFGDAGEVHGVQELQGGGLCCRLALISFTGEPAIRTPP